MNVRTATSYSTGVLGHRWAGFRGVGVSLLAITVSACAYSSVASQQERIHCEDDRIASACETLGQRFALGHGVTADIERAVHFMGRACALGRASA